MYLRLEIDSTQLNYKKNIVAPASFYYKNSFLYHWEQVESIIFVLISILKKKERKKITIRIT